MNKILMSIVVLALVFATGCTKEKPEQPKVNAPNVLKSEPQSYMGTTVNITIVVPDRMSKDKAREAREDAYAVISEVEQQASKYIAASDVYLLNHGEDAAGKSIRDENGNATLNVGEHTYAVVKMALAISKNTDGAFDITAAPLVKMWGDAAKTAEKDRKLPTDDEIAAAKAKVDYRNVECTETTQTVGDKQITTRTITLKGGAQIDLGGIAKGYAVDKAVDVLLAAGIEAGFVEAGGDLRVFGNFPDSQGWPVAIRNYAGKNEIMDRIHPLNKAVATSGEYERGFTHEGMRYSHIINPATGRPITSLCSVSVIAADCATADAIATAISILGPEKGQKLIDEHYTDRTDEKNPKALCDFMVVWPTRGWVETSRN